MSPDTSVTKIDFFDDQAYTRSAYRGSSPIFTCLDQQDIVVQATTHRSHTGDPNKVEDLEVMKKEVCLLCSLMYQQLYICLCICICSKDI